uniref:Thyrotropin-releasing hormone receptor n=1 Tax=Globodera rostochiensis TaxID=31243 RepID=A0A914H7N8_GLORO
MGHNITLMELGWLCTALVSLLRNSPHLVHADQNSQKLLKLISDSKCNSTSIAQAEAAATSTMSSSITNILSDNGLLEKLGAASVTAEQSNQSPPFIDHGHQRLVDWLMTVVYTLISLFGIVGNIFVVIVVRTVPGMISPTNCYLMSLAVSDAIVLLSAAPVELSFLHVDWYAFGSIGCKVLSFLPFLGINSSSMSITAFTVERFIGICYPLRASPWLYLATLIEAGDDVQCGFRLERDDWAYKVMFVADFSAFYLVPMIMYIYIYTRITYTLTRSDIKYSIANDLIHRISQDANTALVSSVPDSPVSPTSNGTKNVPKRSQGRDSVVIAGCGNGGRGSTTKGKLQVIKMLALVVFIFAVSWLPYRAMVMYNSFAKNFNAEMWNPEWFIYLSKTMIFFNW